MAEEKFEQTTTALGFLRSILGRYPFSIGFLREIMQNADDAAASKLVLVLDTRKHPTTSLLDENLSSTQGPALLAFNDAKFVEDDWHALQYAYESSKADNSSKIGKYGVGFRSVFHVTDCPQIVSGNNFAMFDPCKIMGSTGIRKELSTIASQHPSHLVPFGYFAAKFFPEGFDGTVIRCPLRSTPSQIASKVVHPSDISELFQNFIKEEIDISLLFLRNLKNLEIHEIDEDGSVTCLATLSVGRSPVKTEDDVDIQTHIVTTTTTTFTNPFVKTKSWNIIYCPFSKDEAVRLVSKGFPGDATSILKHHKLSPEIGIGFPQDLVSSEKMSGRLFTFLPLPIFTGFPVHIHALFALTESRQNLRNPQEIGVVDGSDDQMLIKWNRLLFDEYIPQAWKLMLESLAQSEKEVDILAAWPPSQGSATSGEDVYWKSLPSNLLKFLTSSESSTWPVYLPQRSVSSTVKYMPLHLLITAHPSTSLDVLDALTFMGLQILLPPLHIYEIIENAENFQVLTPEVAHDALVKVEKSVLPSVSKKHQSTVLEYLLSTGNVLNVVRLPLFPTSNGQVVSLSPRTPEAKSHTLLNRLEYEIFGRCDDDAIPLSNILFKVAEILRTSGPKLLNVENLDIPHIVNYLVVYPNRMGLDLSLVRVDQLTIKWLSTFWIWMGTYEKKQALFGKIRHLYLLPSTQGLRTAEQPLCKALEEHPTVIEALSKLGISFLDRAVPQNAHNVIESFHLLKRITDIHALLDLLPETVPPSAQSISPDACFWVLRHLGTYAPGSYSKKGTFSDKQIQQLKTFPIFPLATFPASNRGIVIEKAPIPDGVSLISIENPPFLPSLPGKTFIQLNKALAVLDYLDWTAERCSVMDILKLTVKNFTSQEDYIQAAALEFLCHNRKNVPPFVIEDLRNLPFVLVKDESRRTPVDVIDPGSKLVELYEETPGCLVHAVTDAEKKIVRSLQDLNLMKRVLTLAIAQDRIDFISESTSSNAIKISRSLISLIINSRLDCSGLQIAPHKRWLPTNQGLRSPAECRDPSSISPSLFDHVLASVQVEPLKIPSSLSHVLGWDLPLPIKDIIQQLHHVLQNGDDDRIFSRVTDILKELSSRAHDPEHFADLKTATSGKKWVPTTDHQLTELQNAVLLAPILESGFHQALCPDLRMREFLERMGCTNRPTVEAIIANLNILKSEPTSLNTVNTSLNVLRSLPETLDDAKRSQLLIPDVTGCLQSFDSVYFNDIGAHAKLVVSETTFIAHNLLEESLAIRLGLGRLGLQHEEFRVPYIDMGQDIVTTIRNNLKHYTDQQIATEFLANAIDAKATEFSLLVNKYRPPQLETGQCLSEQMKVFCTCPSLVIHNNSTFSDEDFIGIRRTGIGGKDGKPDTIGHFGLGALTMFHLAELALIVSNCHVLFLDPSKEHLPILDTASLILPLNRVRKFYPSHLASIDGLFGFDILSDEPYAGTIFILPMRIQDHLKNSSNCISHQIYTVEMLEQDIVEKFRQRGANCFLFTSMTRIKGMAREESGETRTLWSFSAQRAPQADETETGCFATEVVITAGDATLESRWIVATEKEDHIPPEILLSLPNHRLRLPTISGLAFLLEHGTTSQEARSFGFFSTLPLGIETSLPCHVNSTFLLSSDRRSIRLDEYGIESKFNIWLLSSVLPRLYLFLLQVSLEHGDNKRLWPGRHRGKEDAYSQIVIDSFYSEHLRISGRRVFYNAYHSENPLTSQQVVLCGEEHSKIEKFLLKLECEVVVRPPKTIYQLMASKTELRLVNPSFVKSVIMQSPSFNFSEWDFKVIEDCIIYLLDKEGSTSNLLGLAIIPLEDETFGTFQDRSDPDAECYYIWLPHKSSKRHNFPAKHFVHPNLKTKVRENLLKMELNVVLLDASTMRNLIEQTFSSQSHFTPDSDSYRIEASSRLSNWISDFWESWPEYLRLGLSYNDISCFPLVPIVRPSWYTTLSSCRNVLSLLVAGDSEYFEDIRYFLDKLDVNVIRLSSDEELPFALSNIFKEPEYPVLNIENVLKALCGRQHSTSFLEILRDCDRQKQASFADWARNDVKRALPAELQPVAHQLPIWLSACSISTEPELRQASDIHMLPEGVDFDVTSRFMSICVAAYGSLRYFNGPKLNYAELQERVNLPQELSLSDLLPYRRFLELWLPRLLGTEPILIPNGNRVCQLSDTLYARDELFEMAFGTNSPLFIHQDFQELQGLLYRHGLKNESQLNIDMFAECATAFEASQTDDNASNEQIARANALFDAYGFSLPMCVAPDESSRWSELDDLCFIPRNMTRRRLLRRQHESVLGLEIPPNVSALPMIVSPSDLVRAEFEAIAWTQRGAFTRQPDQRVVQAYPSLGRPTVSEVVTHVRILSRLNELSSSQREIVIHDLEASYRFLDENSINGDSEDRTIPDLNNENIFLNVNDPTVDEWKWDKAEELVFETHDIDHSIRHVRNFLSPFRRLLQTAGALQIYHPEYPSIQTLDTSGSKLLSIRSGFQTLREKNVLTDVAFLPDDGQNDDDNQNSGPGLMAHRSFLAVNSEYLSILFAAGYQEGGAASTNQPVGIRLNYSRDAIQLVLDFIYKEERPVVDLNLPLPLVLEILHLSGPGYWTLPDLFEYVQREIAVKLLKPQTLHQVRSSAEDAGAENLLRACIEYEERNQLLMMRFR